MWKGSDKKLAQGQQNVVQILLEKQFVFHTCTQTYIVHVPQFVSAKERKYFHVCACAWSSDIHVHVHVRLQTSTCMCMYLYHNVLCTHAV